jgi:hypothetical protein
VPPHADKFLIKDGTARLGRYGFVPFVGQVGNLPYKNCPRKTPHLLSCDGLPQRFTAFTERDAGWPLASAGKYPMAFLTKLFRLPVYATGELRIQ